MWKITLVVCCLSVLQIASALNCYSCTGSICESDSSKWTKKNCDSEAAVPPNYERVCLKQTYKDRSTQNTRVVRKCALARQNSGKPIYDCTGTSNEQAECTICQADYCNSASSVNFSIVAMCSVALALLAPKIL